MGLFNWLKKDPEIKKAEFVSPATGKIIPIEQVEDETFASKILGDGFAVELTDGEVIAPFDGEVTAAFPTGHAYGLKREDGLECLIHIGLDTVELNGSGFDVKVKQGDQVKQGQVLVKVDLDLFSDSVYCFTPTGDVKNLPAGSCPVDFAYSIHSAVGNKMVGARVNGKLVTIDYELKSGDRVEIITSQNSKGPSRDWLNIVKSTQARNKINQWFKQELKEDNILKGKELITNYCKTKGIVLSDIMKPENQEKTLNKYGFKDWNSLLASVGHGGLKEGQVVNKLVEENEKRKKAEVTDNDVLEGIVQQEAKNKDKYKKTRGGIVVKGIHDVAVRFSKCCNPVPGDEIVGFVTRGRGVTIHRTDCVNVINFPENERERLIEAEWEQVDSSADKYSTEINIFAGNRTGLIVDISRIFTEANIDVKFMNSRVNKKGIATINLGFDIHGKDELNRLVEKLRNIEGVTDIARTAG